MNKQIYRQIELRELLEQCHIYLIFFTFPPLSILSVLLPDIHAPLSPDTVRTIRTFARKIVYWNSEALSGLPEVFAGARLTLARRFAALLSRQTSLNHLIQVQTFMMHSRSQRLINSRKPVSGPCLFCKRLCYLV